jgi:hypothetical protein
MRSRRNPRGEDAPQVAANGLLDRRALLGRGALLAGAMTAGAAGSLTGAAAEPLSNGPWSLAPGVPVPPYGQPSKYEAKVVRTLSNPKLEPRTSGARTPHHLLNGTITPNGLAFCRRPRRRDRCGSRSAPLRDPRAGQAADGLDRGRAASLSDGVAHQLPGMRWQQRAALLQGADPGQRPGAPRPVIVRRMDRRAADDAARPTLRSSRRLIDLARLAYLCHLGCFRRTHPVKAAEMIVDGA